MCENCEKLKKELETAREIYQMSEETKQYWVDAFNQNKVEWDLNDKLKKENEKLKKLVKRANKRWVEGKPISKELIEDMKNAGQI